MRKWNFSPFFSAKDVVKFGVKFWWNFPRYVFQGLTVFDGKLHQNFTSKTVWKTENFTQISLCRGAALIFSRNENLPGFPVIFWYLIPEHLPEMPDDVALLELLLWRPALQFFTGINEFPPKHPVMHCGIFPLKKIREQDARKQCFCSTGDLSCTRLRVPSVALHVSRYTCRSWLHGFYSVLQV